jgi:uncharacterized protein involved in exopolysaccharide biosynthesis
MERVWPEILQPVLSRRGLTDLIERKNLYAAERARLPLEDVIELMRTMVQFGPVEGSSVRISYSHADRFVAQQVTAALVSEIFAEYGKLRKTQSLMTISFLKESASVAAGDWESSLAKVRAAQTAGQAMERVRLDADIARQRYESLSAKVAEAEMLRSLEERQQGTRLEALDPASLPADDRPVVWVWAVLGGLAGGVLSAVVGLVRGGLRRRTIAGELG